ncbi:hypothetical protein FA95DRAFT_1450903, partial [Auriscalpium vulgare]
MLRTADKFNVSFAALRLSRALRRQLPAWYRIGAASKRATAQSSCLRDTHLVRSTADLLRTSHRLSHLISGRPHYPRRTCACAHCTRDRVSGCENPHKCASEAADLLERAAPRFAVSQPSQTDGLSLTHRRLAQNTHARTSYKSIIFDPTVTCKSTLAECFRVF